MHYLTGKLTAGRRISAKVSKATEKKIDMLVANDSETRHMQTDTELKTFIRQIADQLPNDATLDDAIERLVERREIELGLADSIAGRTTPVEQVMREFGIEP